MTIAIEAVFEAAQALKEEGTDTSTRNVQAKLGCKGNSYIAPLTGLWNRRERHLELADELPEAYLEEARLLAFSLWSTAKDRASILEDIHLREIERMRKEIAELEVAWARERMELGKRIEETCADIGSLTDEVGELKQLLSAARDQVSKAETAKADAEERREKAEVNFKNYSNIVQSGIELDKAQLEGAVARAARLEFEIEGMQKRVEDADARRAEEAARFDRLLTEYVGQSGKTPTRQPQATQSPTGDP